MKTSFLLLTVVVLCTSARLISAEPVDANAGHQARPGQITAFRLRALEQ
jgi:hypothetical protein